MKVKTKKKKIIRAKITKKKFFFFWGDGDQKAGRQAGRQAGGGRGRVIYRADLWLNYVWPILRDIFMRHPPKVYTTTIRKKKYLMPNYYVGLKLVFMYS